MKNEVARREIDFLDYYLQNHSDDYSEESHTAMMMAIKALEQEPCEDCISRHAVLETIDNRIEQLKRDVNEINKSYSHLSFAEGIHDGYCRLKCDLRILSSVTPKAKVNVLDKIKAEIEQTTSRYCISKERGGSGQVEWSDRLIKESEVLEIIDKYKVESEGEE